MTLTREEILAMKPGRELDGKVAELVMGLDMVEGQLPQVPRYYLTDYEKTIHRDVPLYSSEISAAWEVLEKLNFEVTVKKYEGMSGYRYWAKVNSADFSRFDERIANCQTAPEAICKAALLAVLNL